MRRLALGLLGAVLVFVAAVVVAGAVLSGPRYAGPRSDHFDGRRFHGMRAALHGGFSAFLKWQLTRQHGPWMDRAEPPGPRPPARVAGGGMRVTFVNHATVLLQMEGLNILTDPIWSERASPFTWVGPKRHHPPGLRFEDLPAIDAVLVSHNHYDHLDLATLERLARRGLDHPRFFVGLGNAPLLTGRGIASDRVTEVNWWQDVELAPGVTLIGVPTQHFSNRGLWDRDATLWLGYWLRGPSGSALFTGDTGDGPHFAEIARRLGPARLAVLPIGAYRPEWFMGGVHMSPTEALRAAETLHARTSVAMHFGTFALADDAQDEPVQALQEAQRAILRRGSTAPSFLTLGFGEGRDVP